MVREALERHAVEVSPGPGGQWVLSWKGQAVSTHFDVASAERAATVLAHRRGLAHAMLRDRYQRVHRIPL